MAGNRMVRILSTTFCIPWLTASRRSWASLQQGVSTVSSGRPGGELSDRNPGDERDETMGP
jgi:hypothetical protein